MPWIEKTVDTGKVVFVKRYWSSRYGTSKQVYRSASEGKTSESQEKVNDKLKVERFSILVNSNFGEGDYFLTFTYARDKRPKTLDEAREQWTKFLRKLRTLYKKNDQELKYCWCYEYKYVAGHFHLVCNNPDINSKHITKLWQYGIIHTKNLDDRAFHSVGEYMMKEQYIKDEKTKTRRCYGSSKNLYRPEPNYVVIPGPDWNENPNDMPGYELDETSLENGEIYIQDINATFRYQSYRMLKQKMLN